MTELARRITPEQARAAAALTGHRPVTALTARVPLVVSGRQDDTFSPPAKRATAKEARGAAQERPAIPALTQLLNEIGRSSQQAVNALLGRGDTALEALRGVDKAAQSVRHIRRFAKSCVRRDLAVAAGDRRCPYGILALGLLRGDGSELPAEVAETLAAIWNELVADVPGLPADPLGWSDMEALLVPQGDDGSQAEAAQPASTEASVNSAGESSRDTVTEIAEPQQFEALPDTSDTERLLERLAELVRPAAEAAERTAAVLREARYPAPADVALINEAADGFRRVVASLNVTLPTDEWDLEMFRTTLERFERLSGTRAELVALTALRGPQWCDSIVTEVRRRAAELVEEMTSTEQPDAADLVALTHFIRLSARADVEDQAETHRLMPLLSERLPKPWLSLLAVAVLRQLELPLAVTHPTPGRAEQAPTVEESVGETPAAGVLEIVQDVVSSTEHPNTTAAALLAAEETDPGVGPVNADLVALDRDIAMVLLPGQSWEPTGSSPLGVPFEPAGPGEEGAVGTEASAEPVDVLDDAYALLTPSPDLPATTPAARPADVILSDTADISMESDASQPAEGVRPETVPLAPPPPAEPEDEADPVVTTSPGAVNPEATAAEIVALRQSRFALAAWIRRAAGEPETTVRVREAAALAKHLNSATGEIAHRCRQLLESMAPEAVAADRPSAILTWAVAIRVGLIMPSASLVTLVRELSPYAARGHQPVADLSEVLANAAQQGAFIVPEILGTVRNEAEAEEQRRTVARQADEFVRAGLQRKIRYQLATEVWLHLAGEGGVIGDLCSRVAQDDLGQLIGVRQQVARLRDVDTVEREIDNATRQVKRRKRIDYGARAKLRSLIGDAVSLAATWADLTGQLKMRTDYKDGNDWLLSRINELRGSVQRLRDPVWRAFAEVEDECGDPLEAAAAFAARTVLGDAFTLLDGQPQPGTSDDVAIVLRGDLLLLADLPLTRLTLEPEAPVSTPLLPRFVALAHGVPDHTAAFEARADRGDHVGTGEIVRVVRTDQPGLAQELRARREHCIKEARDDLRRQLRQLSDRIDSGRRNGLLKEDDWALLTARSNDLADPDRYDFDRMPREADEVNEELERLSEEARRELHDRLNKATIDPRVAEVADRIARRIQADDLTTAEEFLAQAIAGKDLPPDDSEQLGIADFFPAVPAAVSRCLSAAGGGPAAGITELILQVRGVLGSVISPVPPQLVEVMSALGDRRLLGQDRLTGARKVLGQVRNLAQVINPGKQAGQTHFENVRQVFRALGVESGGIEEIQDSDRSAGRLWMRLSGLRLQGDPVLPQFGSLASPLGRTLRVLLVREAAVPAQLLDFARRGPAEETVVVFYLGGVLAPSQWRELAQAARRRRGNVAAVLDLSVLLYLLLRPAPDVGLLTGVLAPFTVADPYTPKAAGDVPEEMFFGRDDELAKVLDPRGSCFVYGGRQLGKSALLRAAMRRVQASNPDRVVILESIYSIGKQPGSSDHLWSALWPKLVEAGVLRGQSPGQEVGQAVHRGIRAWLDGAASRQLLILLDEADDFLRFDAEERAFANVHIIRTIMEDTNRRAKVVFAGLHSTVRFENLSNQPLAHFGQPLSVGPLKPRDAYQLLVKPLGALGYTFHDPSLPARILALANNAPALLQLFATALLERMRAVPPGPDAPPNVITRADVEAVWEDRKLMSDFRERFLWTLNLDNRYRVIAYCVARTALYHGASASATSRELLEECRNRWAAGFSECSSEEFAGLLGECVELGVLGTDGSGFRLRTPNLLRLLGTREEIEEELDQASEQLTLPRRFEGMSYRAGYCGRDTERSPLTMGQIGRLLDAGNDCFIVAGSDITHVSRVPRALEEAHEVGVTGAQVLRAHSLEDLVKAMRKPLGVRHRVIVLSILSLDLAEAREAVRFACDHVGSARPSTGEGSRAVVLVTGPRQSPLWTGAGAGAHSLDVISTRRFDLAGIRLWMWDSNLPFQGPKRQAEFLDRTGGWPVLAHRVAELCAAPEAMGPDEALSRMEAELLADPEELLVRCGLRTNASLSAAWRQLVQLLGVREGEDPEVLAEMLAMPDEGEPGLSPESLRADGYTSHGDLVAVLRTLGALVEDGAGGLLCEPLLARLETARPAAAS